MPANGPSVRITALGCLAALIVLATVQVRLLAPPRPLAANAPAADFSALRAFAYLPRFTTAPHPLGTARHDAARDYLVGQLRALGLTPKIGGETAYCPLRGPFFTAGYVQNIAARLPGAHTTRALMLVAHYDSAPRAAGAGDDGAGVAAILETLRALRAGPPLRNDVIALFTDGEEAGLLGASAFVAHDPWAKDVGVVLNFEGRGDAGSSTMFETSAENGWLVRQLAAVAPTADADADSLSYAIYQHLPNDTDLTMFKHAGLAGMNFAYAGGFPYYHSPLDNPQNLDLRSLQHQGGAMLALARRLGNLDLAHPRAPEAIYFNIVGHAMAVYPEAWVAPLLVIATLLWIAALVLGFRKGALDLGGLLAGAAILLLALLASALTAVPLWRSLELLRPGYRWIPQGQPYDAAPFVLGFLAWALLVSSLAYRLLARRFAIGSLTLGGLFWWWIAALVLSLALPGAAHVFLWPLIFTLIGWIVVFATARRGPRGDFRLMGVLCLAALPAMFIAAPDAYALTLLLPFSEAGAGIGVAVSLLGLLAPYLILATRQARRDASPVQPWRCWSLPITAGVILIACFATGLFRGHFDARHARPDSIAYWLDPQSRQARWVSFDPAPDIWTVQFLGPVTRRTTAPPSSSPAAYLFRGILPRPRFQAAAPAIALPPPQVNVLGDQTAGRLRTLHLRLLSPRAASELGLALDPGERPLAAQLDGEPVRLDPPTARYPFNSDRWGFLYQGLRLSGLDLVLTLRAGEPLRLTVFDASYGLPSLPGFDPRLRPANAIPTPFAPSDMTVVGARYHF